MKFDSYAGFRNGFLTLLTGDSATDGSLDFDQTELLIQLGEDRVYNGDAINGGLRARTMLVSADLPIVGESVALPDGFIELEHAEIGGKALEPAPYAITSAGMTLLGDSIRVWGSGSGPLLVRYFARPAALSSDLHSTFQRYPSLFLYGALCEGADFLGMTSRLQVWEKKFVDLLRSANRAERVAAFNGGSLRIRRREG